MTDKIFSCRNNVSQGPLVSHKEVTNRDLYTHTLLMSMIISRFKVSLVRQVAARGYLGHEGHTIWWLPDPSTTDPSGRWRLGGRRELGTRSLLPVMGGPTVFTCDGVFTPQ